MKKISVLLLCVALLYSGTQVSISAVDENRDVEISKSDVEVTEGIKNDQNIETLSIDNLDAIKEVEKTLEQQQEEMTLTDNKEIDTQEATLNENKPVVEKEIGISPNPQENQNTETINVVENESELVESINSATGDSVITIKGGTTIQLSTPLSVDGGKFTSMMIKSSDSNPVVIKNSPNMRHFTINSGYQTNLKFENIVISGDENSIGGGIVYSGGQSHKLSGLKVINNTIKFNSWEEGFIKVATKNANFEMSDVTFEGNAIKNWKDGTAAAILMFDTQSEDITLNDVTFNNNLTANQQGSPIVAYLVDGSMNVNNLNMNHNEGAGYSGGFYFSGRGNSKLHLSNSNFKNNIANFKGGGFATTLKGKSQAVISNSFFENNFAKRGGGALLSELESDDSNLEIISSKFTNNKTGRLEYNPETGEESGDQSEGGAVAIIGNSGNGTIMISDSKFINNESHSGGALYINLFGNSQARTTLKDSIFEGNISDFRGGAIQLGNQEDASGYLYKIYNTNIKGNYVTGKDAGPSYYQGGDGGGIYIDLSENPDSLLLDNVSFDDNHSPFPLVWHYDPNCQDSLNSHYTSHVINTKTETKPFDAFIRAYDNVYNGNDVFYEYNAITYYEFEDSAITPQNYKPYQYVYSLYGQHNVEPIEPMADGYKFIGWFTDSGKQWNFDTDILEETELTLYGRFEPISRYTVTFSSEGGSAVNPINNVLENELISEPEMPTRNGYSFSGWYTNTNYTTEWNFDVDTVTSDLELHAKWEAVPETLYSVIFDSNGGSLVDSIHGLKIDGLITKPEDPTRSDYIFLGWYYDKELKNDWNFTINKITGNLTLYAKWEAKTVKPVDPVDPVDPVNPVDPVEPTKPTDPIKSTDSPDGNKSSKLPETGVNNYSFYVAATLIILGSIVMIKSNKKTEN